MSASTGANAPSQAEDKPSAQKVGVTFVTVFYPLLVGDIQELPKFYSQNSVVSYNASKDEKPVSGPTNIAEKISSLGFHGCKIKLLSVDSQESLNNSVLVCVVGEIAYPDQPFRRFSQSFFLAPQAQGFFVLNDVFRITDPAGSPVPSSSSAAASVAEESFAASSAPTPTASVPVVAEKLNKITISDAPRSAASPVRSAPVSTPAPSAPTAEPAAPSTPVVEAPVVAAPASVPAPVSVPSTPAAPAPVAAASQPARQQAPKQAPSVPAKPSSWASVASSKSESSSAESTPVSAPAAPVSAPSAPVSAPAATPAPAPATQIPHKTRKSSASSQQPQNGASPAAAAPAPTSAPQPPQAPRQKQPQTQPSSSLAGSAASALQQQQQQQQAPRPSRPHINESQPGLAIADLDVSITDAEVREIFEPYGKISHIVLPQGPEADKKKRSLLVFFDADAPVNALLDIKGFTLKGKVVRMRRFKPITDNARREREGQNQQSSADASASGAPQQQSQRPPRQFQPRDDRSPREPRPARIGPSGDRGDRGDRRHPPGVTPSAASPQPAASAPSS